MTTTTMPWKAGRLVCRAPRLLRFGGCWCPAEGPGRHPLADLGRGRPVAVAHHGCSVWSLCNFTRSSDVLRQHQVFWNSSETIWHWTFGVWREGMDCRKTVYIEDFKFGIWWNPAGPRKMQILNENGWVITLVQEKSVEPAQDESAQVLGHVVCHSQLAPQQLQRSLDEGRIFIHQPKKKCLCAWNAHTHTHSMVIFAWLVQWFNEVDWLLIWRDGLLSGVLWSEWYQFTSLGQLEV